MVPDLSGGAIGRNSVVTLGEIVVEIMADERGQGFRQAQRLTGPFPSGAPAIFIDQVARLGHSAGLISCVGDDDFGWLNIERLREDGVDVSAIDVLADQVTGTAFVRYREDGERDFVFNIRNSACSRTRVTEAAHILLERCRHFHVMGSSLFSPALIAEAEKAVAMVRQAGGTVSFDPNIRREMLAIPGMRDGLEAMLRQCDLFMPSGAELTLLTRAASEQGAIDEILAGGISAIVVKRGADGASYHDADGTVHMPAFEVPEIDPTGAGDCFGATFVTCRLNGHDVRDSLRYANASGALAVGVRGPMQGTSDFAQLDRLIGTAR